MKKKKKTFCFLRQLLCLALAILELPRYIRLASNSEIEASLIYLPLPRKWWD